MIQYAIWGLSNNTFGVQKIVRRNLLPTQYFGLGEKFSSLEDAHNAITEDWGDSDGDPDVVFITFTDGPTNHHRDIPDAGIVKSVSQESTNQERKELKMSELKYPYPFVECDQHEGPQRGLIVCNHIMFDDASIHHYEPPSDEELGVALCRKCTAEDDAKLSFCCTLTCEQHFNRKHRERIQ